MSECYNICDIVLDFICSPYLCEKNTTNYTKLLTAPSKFSLMELSNGLQLVAESSRKK